MAADELRASMARAMTEDELLAGITDAATFLGWRWMHVRRSDLAIVQGHQGFPDLVLARDGDVVFAELKTELGNLTPEQVAWGEQLQRPWDDDQDTCDTWRPTYYVIRPRTYDAFLGDVLGAVRSSDANG